MLVLRRSDGQWVELTHEKTGDVIRVRVWDVRGPTAESPGRCDLVFDDSPRNFVVERHERRKAREAGVSQDEGQR